MNAPGILMLIRHHLQRAIARRGSHPALTHGWSCGRLFALIEPGRPTRHRLPGVSTIMQLSAPAHLAMSRALPSDRKTFNDEPLLHVLVPFPDPRSSQKLFQIARQGIERGVKDDRGGVGLRCVRY